MLQALLSALTFGALGREGDRTYNLGDPRATEIFGSNRANSGVPVTTESALTCSPWYRGIDLLSDSIGKTPGSVFKLLPDEGGKEADRAHPWFRAINRKPGPNWTAFQFFKLMVSWVRSQGNAYAFIDRDANELIPVCPSRITPVIEGDGSNAKLWYVLDQSKRKYNADEILHFKGFGFDGLLGYSVIDKAKESIGLSMGARLHQSSTLKNSGRPSVLLTTPNKMNKPARDELLSGWSTMHSGGNNAGRTAVLDNGLEAKPYMFSSQEMELMETQRFSVRDISNFLGVPAHKLGDVSRQGYNSLEQENLSFLGDTLEAILVNIEQELEDKLLTEKEKDEVTHEIRFDRSALSMTDQATKDAHWRTALGGHPWATPAEARKASNMNHKDGTDDIPEPANMGKGGEANTPTDSTGNFPKGRAEAVQALDAGVRRLLRKVSNQAKAKAGNPDGFLAWVDSLKKENLESAMDDLKELESLCASWYGGEICGKVAQGVLTIAENDFKRVAETASAKELVGRIEATCERLAKTPIMLPWLKERN